MRKNQKKYAAVLISALVTAAMITSCSGAETKTDDTDTSLSQETTLDTSESDSTDANTAEVPEDAQTADESPIYGQITAIDGNTITLALAESPMGSGEKPEGEAPEGADGEKPEMPDKEAPEGTDGEKPEMPDGEAPEGTDGEAPEGTDGEKPDMPDSEGGMGALTLTGEELTLTVSDSTTYTIDGETVSLSDLTVDTVVFVTMDGDTVISISTGMERSAK
ncbi:MAG: hypothetical protein HGA25_10230 [Clostridiales bacterium]|nr:hypothetical protein [Clostridiales bacterium]